MADPKIQIAELNISRPTGMTTSRWARWRDVPPNGVDGLLCQVYKLFAVVEENPKVDVSSIVGAVLVNEIPYPENGEPYVEISEFEYRPFSNSSPTKEQVAVAFLKIVDARAKEKGLGVRVLATIPLPGDMPDVVDFEMATTFQELGFKIAAGMSAGSHVDLGPRPSLDHLRELNGLVLTRGLGFTINLQAALGG